MDLETNMKSMGKRFPYLAEYTVSLILPLSAIALLMC